MAVTSIPSGPRRGAPSTLVEVLRTRAVLEGDRVAYTFLPDGEGEEQQLTYGELDREARAIAAAIGGATYPGQRALLLYPPGLHFISGFFGCLYAGVVAVPVYPPHPTRLEQTLARLYTVAADARVAIVLTTREIVGMARTIREGAPDLKNSEWLATDAVQGSTAEEWREPVHSPEALAYLQYTSGSTAAPRGVMVSHANVLENLALIEECFEHTRESRGVIWLPPYHDMGLVGGVLQPLYVGFPVTLLSPVSFLKRPLRWLQAISRYRADVSGGPNFAYELCVRKIDSEQKRALDLSSWQLAFSGAEPVRAETLDRFLQAFGPCGFRREAFYPCYGLAEATLIVSGGLKHAAPVVRNIERRALEGGRAVEARAGSHGAISVVGCGRALRHETIRVVDPESLDPSPPGDVGEIWVSGQSIAQGYWNLPEETERLFHARPAGSVGDTFLRTGDLGFLLDGELFVTGRLKDLIVIRGRNLTPSDIELTVGRSHPSLRPGCAAAFSIDVDEEERLVVAHEIDASAGGELEGTAAAIRREVVEVHGIEVSAVVLVEPHGIPKTSSGKVQRHACRAGFLAGTLPVLHEWRAGLLVSEGPARSVAPLSGPTTLASGLVRGGLRPGSRSHSNTANRVPSLAHARQAGSSEGSAASEGSEGSVGSQASAGSQASVLRDLATETSLTSSKLDDHAEPGYDGVTSSTAPVPTVASIQDWLISWLGAELRMRSEDIDTRQPFSRYGLASAGAVALCGDLEDFLGRRLSPTLLYEYPTIEALARHLVASSELAEPVGHVRVRRRPELEPVAITGIGCRFPGADGPEAFWELLRDGMDAITEVPAARRDLRRFCDPDLSASEKITARWGGFIEQVDHFDHHFFEISPREAARMDPQQRLLLEVAWESLEDAGQPPDRLAGTPTGVFIGISTNDYAELQFRDPAAIDGYAVTGNASSIAANRLSYVLDLRGPSMAVDTACSSSLVAVHLACQSLRNGESSLALAGGVNAILSPAITMGFTKAGVMAPDGRCKAFDARGDGYVRSEGAGVVVLKLLSKALADGDIIRAVIRGSAVNQDGRTNGILAPNPRSQAAVLREAYARAGVSPGEVQYVEAHGTGTFLGDPIEAEALGAVFAVDRAPDSLCAVGSVKTNIGHLEAAAGIAGLIKVALSLEHRAIPPSLHFKEPNPHIPFGAFRLRVPKILEPWPAGRGPALAGVSSFGFGGTNAHVVLEESPASTSGGEDVTSANPGAASGNLGAASGDRAAAPGCQGAPTGGRAAASGDQYAATNGQVEPSGGQAAAPGHRADSSGGQAAVSSDEDAARGGEYDACGEDVSCRHDGSAAAQACLLPLSARAPEALRALAQAYQERFSGDTRQAAGSLNDICYAASTRRSHHEHRLAVVARSREELAESLGRFVNGEKRSGTFSGRVRSGARHKLVFVFPGQGPKWWPLARELLEGEMVFRTTLERCDELLRERGNVSFLERLTADEHFRPLGDADLMQSAFFAVQVALVALWRSWGIEPDAVVGHSVGEVAAAHVAGALDLEDAVRVVFQRGRLIRRVAGEGRMAIVELSLAAAREEITRYESRLCIAATNSPTSTVLSGEPAALREVLGSLQARGVFCRPLESVDFASHSPQMAPLQPELTRSLAGIDPRNALIPIVSTVTGQPCDGWDLDAAYWSRNLREPVLFSCAVDRLVDAGHDVFVEMSPHPVLAAAIGSCLRHRGREGTVLTSLRRGEEGREVMLGSVGALYALGYTIDWRGLYGAGGRSIRLPSYPWQRERCWLERGEAPAGARGEAPGGKSGEAVGSRRGETVRWEQRCQRRRLRSRPPRFERAALNTRDAAAPETLAMPETLDGCLYEPCWELTEQLAPHLATASRSHFPTDGQGSWLIFTERSGVGMTLEALLTARGETSVLAFPAERYERVEPNRYLVDPSCPADFERLMADAFPDDARVCRSVVHMWSMGNIGSEGMTSGADGTACSQPSLSVRLNELSSGSSASSSSEAASQRPLGGVATQPGGECGPEPAVQVGIESPPENLSAPSRVWPGPDSRIASKSISIDAALDLGCISVLHLVQSMARARWREAPRLWLVTRGAQSVTGETEIAVAQSPVWGLGRVVSQEHPEFRCKRLDLAPGGTPQEGREVLHELLLPDEEDEIAFRNAERYVHRLVQYGSRAGRSELLAGVSKKLEP